MPLDISTLQRLIKLVPPDMRGVVIGGVFAGGLGYLKYSQDVGALQNENRMLWKELAHVVEIQKSEQVERRLLDQKVDRKFDDLKKENAYLREKYFELAFSVGMKAELKRVTQQAQEVQKKNSEGILFGTVKKLMDSLQNAKTAVEAEQIIDNFKAPEVEEPTGGDKTKE